jgi:hypothetical protein
MLHLINHFPLPQSARKRISPGSTVPLELNDRERELILKHSLAGDDLTRRLRLVPPPGRSLVVRYTLDDLDDLAGYVAADANHIEDRKLRKKWDRLFTRIVRILETHTDQAEKTRRDPSL